MKTTLTLIVLSLLLVSVIPGVLANDTGLPMDIDITTEDFDPLVWGCDSRVVLDDALEYGRTSEGGEKLVERTNLYAFAGEKLVQTVLVLDKNKIDQNIDVAATLGSDQQGEGNDRVANCQRIGSQDSETFRSCNAKIDEELVEWNPDIMDFFECILTVPDAHVAAGPYWITVEALDTDGGFGTMAENENWFLNPFLALSIDGDLVFGGEDGVRPGTSSYSETLRIGNDAEDDSGVMMDMFISGTNFGSSDLLGQARCPSTNELSLTHFRYFATNGAYSSRDDAGIGREATDVEGYVEINQGNVFNNPLSFYDANEILQDGPKLGPYWMANILSPGSEMSLTFRLDLPEPCNGDFDTGGIFFWGEAI